MQILKQPFIFSEQRTKLSIYATYALHIIMWYFGRSSSKRFFFVLSRPKRLLDGSLNQLTAITFASGMHTLFWFDSQMIKNVIEKLIHITHSFSLFSPMHKWNLPFLGFSSVHCIHLRSVDVNETNMLFSLHLCHCNARLQLQLYTCVARSFFFFFYLIFFS